MESTRSERRRGLSAPAWNRLKLAACGSIVLAAMVYLFLLDPAGASVYPACPFHRWTGWHCPGCGTLRASHQLLHGNLLAALSLNPLAMICLPFLAYSGVRSTVATIRWGRLPTIFIPSAWIWAFLAVVILYWIGRNIPAYPFSLLAP